MNALPRAEQSTLLHPELAQSDLTSPKRATERSSISGKMYSYYAGFSEDFVRDVLRRSQLKPETVVLDPWNGSGTTVKAAAQAGVMAEGFDLNPVMVVVAKARLSVAADFILVKKFLSETVGVYHQCVPAICNDPLDDWVGTLTASQLRHFISAILDAKSSTYVNDICSINALADSLPAWRCLILLAVFRAVKTQLGIRDASNPTWTVLPTPNSRRALDLANIFAAVSAEIERTQSSLASSAFELVQNVAGTSRVRCGSSDKLRLQSETVDLVITSPPYCTRIDYAKATLLELTLFGLSTKVVDAGLRRALIGTTAIQKDLPERSLLWGQSCMDVLDYTYSHSSKGSRSYYYKNQLQYFHSMFSSMKELARVCKPGALLYIVVQESFYKEKKIDLPLILREMGLNVGISAQNEVVFPVRLSMVNINTKSRRYRQNNDVDEKVLILRRD